LTPGAVRPAAHGVVDVEHTRGVAGAAAADHDAGPEHGPGSRDEARLLPGHVGPAAALRTFFATFFGDFFEGLAVKVFWSEDGSDKILNFVQPFRDFGKFMLYGPASFRF
jgi:hypothetical protein